MATLMIKFIRIKTNAMNLLNNYKEIRVRRRFEIEISKFVFENSIWRIYILKNLF